MSAWDLNLNVDTASAPLFLRISRAISDDIRRHRLKPGDRLPGSRSLSRALRVHRNTVVAAYLELLHQGWIETRPAGGTFVSRKLPDVRPRGKPLAAAVSSRLGFDLGPAVPNPEPGGIPPGTLNLGSGLPDVRVLPMAALARAYRRALSSRGGAMLSYGDPRGHPRLRAALAEMISATRGLAAKPESLVVTRGSSMAIDLAARALVSAGDAVAVEELSYPSAWTSLRLAGARLISVPLDREGLRVDVLEQISAKERLRAIYVTPHHQYPTMRVLSPGRRLQLLDLARRNRFAIIEDDYDHEFHYQGRPVLPLASADGAGVVIYIGTLSKILAPGLRLGFMVAPEPLLERVVEIRRVMDRQGDQAVEYAVAELLEEGEVQRHVRKMRRAYQGRREVLVQSLRRHLGSAIEFDVPSGGMALWARVQEGTDVDAWLRRALSVQVAFSSGREFALDGRPKPFARFAFSAVDETEIEEGVRRLARALTEKSKPTALNFERRRGESG